MKQRGRAKRELSCAAFFVCTEIDMPGGGDDGIFFLLRN